jgi:hypothetical protein
MAEILEQIKQLSYSEQLALIREIPLNLEEAQADELSPEQRAALEESSQAARLSPCEGSDWATVRTRLLSSASFHQTSANCSLLLNHVISRCRFFVLDEPPS